MKKGMLKATAFALIMVLTLSITACGKQTLEDYFSDPEVMAEFEEEFSGLEGTGMSVAIDAEDNDFILTIKIEDEALMVDGMAEALEAGLDAQADGYKAQVAEFDEAIGQEGACTATIRYLDPSDNVLAERTFSAY